MPVVSITLLAGYGPETEARLVQRVALATRSVIAAPAAGTTVFVKHAATYLREGRGVSGGGPALPDASALVHDFLESMQARDLAAARAHLAPGFEMVFPGGARMAQLEQLVEFAATRYRSVGKVYERIDECWGEDATIVYASGTLQGTWLDGTAFSGIRFIDRFEVAQGRIRRQEVWNDLAEAKRA
jgi:hypothetical protein